MMSTSKKIRQHKAMLSSEEQAHLNNIYREIEPKLAEVRSILQRFLTAQGADARLPQDRKEDPTTAMWSRGNWFCFTTIDGYGGCYDMDLGYCYYPWDPPEGQLEP